MNANVEPRTSIAAVFVIRDRPFARRLAFALALVFSTFLLGSCTAEQIRAFEDELSVEAPAVIAAVAEAYGPPYSDLVNSFYEIAGYYDQASTPGLPEPGGYQEPSPEVGQQLRVQIDVLKEAYSRGRYTATPISDGDVLTRENNYKVAFRANRRAYVYVVQLDSTGKMDPIFPSRYATTSNPVKPNKLYLIPSADRWFFLDENLGVETIYFIVSRWRRPDLERLLTQFQRTNQSLVQLSQVSMKDPLSFYRGIAGVRPGETQLVNFQDGSQGQYSSTLFSSVSADLVLTRWFHHR